MTDLAQRSLFVAAPDSGTARRSDPWSSKEAARRVDVTGDKALILDAFVANGGHGTLDTAHDAALAAGKVRTQRGTLSRRISDLCEAGRLRETGRYVEGSYGSPLMVFEVVDRG